MALVWTQLMPLREGGISSNSGGPGGGAGAAISAAVRRETLLCPSFRRGLWCTGSLALGKMRSLSRERRLVRFHRGRRSALRHLEPRREPHALRSFGPDEPALPEGHLVDDQIQV